MRRLRICVLSAVYPTREDPTRGTPVWATLSAMRGKAEFRVFCSMPKAPAIFLKVLKPRTYLRLPTGVAPGAATGFEAASLPFFFIPGVTRSFNGLFLRQAFESEVRAYKPDVLLAYRVYPDGYAAVRTGERLGIPAVISSRGSDLKLLPRRGLVRRHTVHAVGGAAAVLCVSEDLGNIARSLREDADAVHVVRNGIDKAVFRMTDQQAARRRLGVETGRKVVVFVGNLLPVKGIGHLIEAVAELERSQPGEWLLVLLGEGPLQPALENQAAGAAIAVKFAGRQDRAAVAEWINAADVFCLPSLSEGLPNVIIEALACGRAVVATAVGGNPELIEEGNNGFLVPRADAHALAQALARALRTDWDRERIAASYGLSWDDVADRTIAICDSAVTGNGRRRE